MYVIVGAVEPRRRRIVWLIAAATLAGAAVAVWFGLRGSPTPRPSVPPAPTIPPEASRPAPDFRLRSFDGRVIALSDYRGKVVILNFWASWCTPCKQEMPNLERVWQEFKDRGVVVLGIDVLDDMEDAAAFLEALKITYPNIFDPGNARMNTYRVTALPTTIFIDRQQRQRARFVGGYLGEAGYADLRRQVLDLLRPEP